jgi:hypothetical protein
MSKRAEALADEFEDQIGQLTKEIEQCTDRHWQSVCGDEGWTVAATAQHVAAQFPLEMEYLTAAAAGTTMPSYTWDDINTLNERRAQEMSAAGRDDVLKLLRENSAKAASFVRGLSDEQLDRRSPLPLANGAEVSTQDLIEGGVLIDHARGHLKSIRAVLA